MYCIEISVHGDMTAEELTKALYPNLTSGTSLISSTEQVMFILFIYLFVCF